MLAVADKVKSKIRHSSGPCQRQQCSVHLPRRRIKVQTSRKPSGSRNEAKVMMVTVDSKADTTV